MRKILRFLGEVRTELSKVVWPTRAKAARLTVVVVIVSVLFGAFLAAVDYGLGKGVQFAIDTTQKGKKSTSASPAGNTQSVPVSGANGQPAQVPVGTQPNAAPANPAPANPSTGQ